MRILLVIMLFLFSFKSDKEKTLDKILLSPHFTILREETGCFNFSAEKIELDNFSKTIKYYKDDTIEVALLPADIKELKKLIFKGLSIKSEHKCTSHSITKITNGIDSLSFDHDDCSFTEAKWGSCFYSWEKTLEKRKKNGIK